MVVVSSCILYIIYLYTTTIKCWALFVIWIFLESEAQIKFPIHECFVVYMVFQRKNDNVKNLLSMCIFKMYF